MLKKGRFHKERITLFVDLMQGILQVCMVHPFLGIREVLNFMKETCQKKVAPSVLQNTFLMIILLFHFRESMPEAMLVM